MCPSSSLGMKKMRKRLWGSLIFSSVILICYFLFFYPVLVLNIKNYKTGRVLYRQKVSVGYPFATYIRHSVHLTPVYEYYKVNDDGMLHVVETRLQDLGWGVPSTCKQEVRFENGFMVIRGLNIPLSLLPFRVSYVAAPRLLLDGGHRDINLKNYFNDMERMDISAEKMSYFEYLTRGESDVFQEKRTGESYS